MNENTTIPIPGIPTNETPATPENSVENSVEDSAFSKVVEAGSRVFEKFGLHVKRGRGRPKKDGSPKANDVVLPADYIPGAAPAPTGCDPLRGKLFVAGCAGILKGAVAFCKSWVKSKASEAGIDKAFTEKPLGEAMPGPDDYNSWQNALEVCAHQYGWDFEHMPAVVLGVETVKIFTPFVLLHREFAAEIKRNREAAEARTAQPTPPGGGK